VNYAFLTSFVGLAKDDKKKLFLEDYPNVTSLDYDEITTQLPTKTSSQIEKNSAYLAIKAHFQQIFKPTVPIHPVINLTESESKKETITNTLPLVYAGAALSDILFQLTKRKVLNSGYSVTFPEVQFIGETTIPSTFQSFY